jgi:ABC-type multidrug transport system ATPase subunit
MASIRLDAVTKRLGGRVVLRDVTIAVPAGSAWTVRGANGSGKSTLLRLMAGVTTPSSGRVTGIPAKVGYLPELFTPPLLLRADAYLHHIGRMAGLPTPLARQRTSVLLSRLSIAPAPHRRLGALSKGNLQKVGIAQAFLAAPELVVLDEPRTGLETSAWPVLDELIDEHVADGGTVVTSEHHRDVLDRAGRVLSVQSGGVALEPHGSPVCERWFTVRAHPTSAAAKAIPAPLGPLTARTVGPDDHGDTEITVGAKDKDAVLLGLLQAGWTVDELRAEEP